VVGTPIAGTPEEIIEGETGFMIQPGDIDAIASRLITLLEDEAMRVSMGLAGRARVEQYFDNEVVCTRLIGLWQAAIEAKH
jgi:glycosyltransferase involved in cell wall biosynthesis